MVVGLRVCINLPADVSRCLYILPATLVEVVFRIFPGHELTFSRGSGGPLKPSYEVSGERCKHPLRVRSEPGPQTESNSWA